MKTYISGRITGLNYEKVKRNFRNGMNEVIAMGYEAVSPLFNGLPDSATWAEHMVKDIEILLGCEAIYMLNNWEQSKGARVEKNIAEEMGFKVMYQSKEYIPIERLEEIKDAIQEVTGLSIAEYAVSSRELKYLHPRVIFSEMVRRNAKNAPNSFIGDHLKRDSATIIHYKGLYEDRYAYNKEFRELAQGVEKLLKTSVSE